MNTGNPHSIWRQHKAQNHASAPDITIGLAGSFALESAEPWLGAYLLQRGFKNPHINIGPFNQIHQVCRDPKAAFGERTDAIVLIWRIEDIFPDLMASPSELADALENLAQSIDHLKNIFPGTIIVSSPSWPVRPDFNFNDLEQHTPARLLFAKVTQRWAERIIETKRVRLLDLNTLLMKTGMNQAYDPRKWLLYRQPWSENFLQAAMRQTGRMICARHFSPKKCIVLDADNTLWGGIIGEDGIANIALGNEFPGNAYRAFQESLLHLQKKGVMLAVASKNNESDFFEMLDTHDAMVLKRDHFTVFKVNWESKADNIRSIAQELNIGIDSIVFIDDSAKELAEVRERLPGVICIQTPEDLEHLPGVLDESDYFDFDEITDEDRQRTKMMRTDLERKKSQQSLSEDDFKKSLDLVVKIYPMHKQHIARTTQLINKTNQFNLTTIRRTQDEIEELTRSPRHKIRCMELKDKYGDYGLVGVAILEKETADCIIDTLLISCRALGRDAETAFLSDLARTAQEWDCKTISGRYIPTAKNMQTADFYKNHNFTAGDENKWKADVKQVKRSPPHITLSVES